MRAFQLFLTEVKSIFNNRKMLIPVIAVMFIPVLYAGLFLWAFKDPYAKMDQLPVAVINLDKGATVEGKKMDIGDELVKNLQKGKDFKWMVVDKKEGEQGLHNRKYYMAVEIPENFSENASTVMDKHPKKLEIRYMPNASSNFLSAQIGGSAMVQIKDKLASEITTTYAKVVLDQFPQVSDGFKQAADGASKLHDGTTQAADGVDTVRENLGKIAENTVKLKKGLSDANDGAKQLSAGAGELNNGAGQLKQGLGAQSGDIAKLADGASQLNGGAKELSGGLGQLNGAYSQKLMPASEQLLNGSMQVREGVKQAAAGINEMKTNFPALANGVSGVDGGAKRVAQGTAQLASSAPRLENGSKQLNQGLEALSPKLQQAIQTNPNLPEDQKQALIATLNQLTKGSGDVAGGAMQINKGISDLNGGAQQLAKGTDELNTKVKANADKLTKTDVTPLVAGANQLAAGQEQFVNGFRTFGFGLAKANAGSEKIAQSTPLLAQGTSDVSAGWNSVVTNVGKLQDGAAKLEDGTKQLTDGTGKLYNGSSLLADGSYKLVNGSKELSTGMTQLKDGSKELSTKLSEGAEKTGKVKANDDTYRMFAEPVKLKNDVVNDVPNYGTGFTPYFLSLGLYVGALILSIVLVFREPIKRPKSAFHWFFSKFLFISGIAIIEALLADVVILFGLDIHVQSVGYFILFSIVTAITFVALIQFFVTVMGDPGRFLAIIILIIQLTTSAGTFPLEMIPNALQAFNAWLPMTYSVAGFKAVISSGDFAFMWENVCILLGFTLLMMAGTMGYFKYTFKRKFQILSED